MTPRTLGALRRIESSAVRHTLLSLVSQLANTGTNLAVAVLVAHATGASTYGAWAVAYAAYALSLQVMRALVSTLVMIHPDVGDTVPHWLERQSESAAALVGAVCGAVLLSVCWILPAPAVGAAVVIAVGLPLMLVQDCARYNAFRNSRGGRAAVLDAVWAVVQLAAVVAVIAVGVASATSLTGAWVLGGVVSGCAWLVSQRRGLSVKVGWGFVSDQRRAGMKLLAESLLGTGALNLLPPLLVVASGYAVAGGVRASQSVFGPVTLLITGAIPLVTTVLVKRARQGRSHGGIVVALCLVVAVVSALTWLVMQQFPDAGRALAGQSWPLIQPIMLPMAVATALRGPFFAAPMVLRASSRLDAAIVLRLRTALPAVVLPVVGAFVWGLSGAAWGMAAAAMINGAQSLPSLAVRERALKSRTRDVT